MVMGAVLFFLASLLSGAVTRRWVVVPFVVSVWPVYITGLLLGLWGFGVGDGWQAIAVVMTTACGLGGILGVAAGRAVLGRARLGLD